MDFREIDYFVNFVKLRKINIFQGMTKMNRFQPIFKRLLATVWCYYIQNYIFSQNEQISRDFLLDFKGDTFDENINFSKQMLYRSVCFIEIFWILIK